ncbi:unnamed protein product [Wuchereria bancrofti]|uniref:Uncharacterized protein n=2 Tax=Wuchereria bancrofti TaxID=6293 RepID=A0A3P7FFT9_WUCBA|nr:unnamed protein product [Wuchereria bancrofti]
MITDKGMEENISKRLLFGNSNEIELVGAEISHKQELSVISGATSLDLVSKLEEGSLNVPELLDDSDEASSASLMRHHIQQAIDDEPKRILTSDESSKESAGDYKTKTKFW